MNKSEIIKKLKEMGVECDPLMTKADLELLLSDPENKNVAGEIPIEKERVSVTVPQGIIGDPPSLPVGRHYVGGVVGDDIVDGTEPIVSERFKARVDSTSARAPLEQYNPKTHYVVNKKKFDEMVVCMVSQRTKAYLKMSMATRLAELLELGENGDNKARELIGAMFARVANGE